MPRILHSNELQYVSGGTDYYTWSQYGLAIGATLGVLHAFKGPMTGAALAFKPFEMVLHGAVGAGIGIVSGIAAGFLYETGKNAIAASQSGSSSFSLSNLAFTLPMLL